MDDINLNSIDIRNIIISHEKSTSYHDVKDVIVTSISKKHIQYKVLYASIYNEKWSKWYERSIEINNAMMREYKINKIIK